MRTSFLLVDRNPMVGIGVHATVPVPEWAKFRACVFAALAKPDRGLSNTSQSGILNRATYSRTVEEPSAASILEMRLHTYNCLGLLADVMDLDGQQETDAEFGHLELTSRYQRLGEKKGF